MAVFRMMEIDLSTQYCMVHDVSPLFEKLLGGTGVATRLLLDSPADIDPLAPEAPVFFAIGPFSSVFPVATKTVALFKSPLTGNLGESHAGGRLAMALYGAGIHVLKITGKAPGLSYLVINEEQMAIRTANSLKGMSALATERVLRDREDATFKRSILRIGPAGERLSPIAEVTVDSSRHFGRLGLGCVLGSKNLKAIVISGGKYWPIENPGPFNLVYKKIFDGAVKSPVMKKYHTLGTPVNVVPLSRINGLPTRNFSQGFFESAEHISGERFAEKHLCQQIACAHCPVGCIHMAGLRESFDPEEHHYKTFKVSYDHELIYAWGSNLSIPKTEDVLKLLVLVEKQGWDSISMGVTLAWAIEAFQKGFLGPKETDGLILNFGDVGVIEKILTRIIAGHNEFFRDLERGAAACSEKYGGKELAIVFGKNEAAGYMTGLYSFLGYATGVRHSHLDAAGYSIDQNNLAKPQADEDSTRALYKEASWRMVLNSLVVCLFARNIYDKATIIECLEALNIKGWTEARLLETGRRIHTMKWLYKNRCGFSFDHLTLPGKLARVETSAGKVSPERFAAQVAFFRGLVETDLREFSF